MEPSLWEEVAEYVSAGGIVNVSVSDDLTSIRLYVIYGNEENAIEAHIGITCLECSYMDMRRVEHHEAGPGDILEAYLHTNSPLINDLLRHKLQGVAGTLPLESNGREVRHLEVIGEISINVLCESVEITAKGLPKLQNV